MAGFDANDELPSYQGSSLMSQFFTKFCGKLFLLVFLLFCIALPGPVVCQSGNPNDLADRGERVSADSGAGAQAPAQKTSGGKSKAGSFIVTEVEPLLLLLLGLLLFSVATGIKAKLSRANPVMNRYFDPFVSRPADQSGTRP
jgi:hypothetical protein